MKVNFEIELKDNSDSFAALLALITQASGGNVETPKKPKAVKPKSDVEDEFGVDDDGTGEDETPTETAAQKKKRLAAEKKAAATEKKAAAVEKKAEEEMSGDETDALNDMDEEELRSELKKSCKKYRATYGKAALVAVLREHDGVKDDGSPSMSAVPEENLIDLIKELQED